MKFLLHHLNGESTMLKVTTFLVSIFVFTLLNGCDNEPTFPSVPARGIIQVNNHTGYNIGLMRFRFTDATQNGELWSRNLFEDVGNVGDVLYTNSTVSLYMSPGTYDFRFEDATGQYFWTNTEIAITVGQTYQLDLY